MRRICGVLSDWIFHGSMVWSNPLRNSSEIRPKGRVPSEMVRSESFVSTNLGCLGTLDPSGRVVESGRVVTRIDGLTESSMRGGDMLLRKKLFLSWSFRQRNQLQHAATGFWQRSQTISHDSGAEGRRFYTRFIMCSQLTVCYTPNDAPAYLVEGSS